MINAPTSILLFTFAASLTGAVSIIACSIASFLRSEFRFFPPPSKDSWQHATFLFLFRLFVYPLVALSILTFAPPTSALSSARLLIGAILLVTGFGLAFRITLQMGWRNAFGEKRGLKTDGWFAWSRNPVYVFTWLGLLGWGLISYNGLVTVLLCTWAMLYVLAPYFEEPWLEVEYGEPYRKYKQQVRRFF